LGTKEFLTATQERQNPYAERLIGSIRRECLNHFVILNARRQENAVLLFPLLSRIENTPGLGEAMSHSAPGYKYRENCRHCSTGGLDHRYGRVARQDLASGW